ncbi:unnamed protein product, partial [Allacma fusca]
HLSLSPSQDIYYEEWEDFFDGECITSCNKVENCLASEFHNPHAVPRPMLPSAMKRLKKRPGLHTGLMGTAAAVAHGVASVGTRLPLTIHEQDSAESIDGGDPDQLDVLIHNSNPLPNPSPSSQVITSEAPIPTTSSNTPSTSNKDSSV